MGINLKYYDESSELQSDIAKAKDAVASAQEFFNNCSPEDIDTAIFRLNAAESRLRSLCKKAKKKIYRDDYYE